MVIGATGKFWPFKPIGLNGPRFSYTKSQVQIKFEIAIVWKNILIIRITQLD